MKPYHAISVFVLLLFLSLTGCWRSYSQTKELMQEDMNQALEKTLTQQHSLEITLDTIHNYQKNVHTSQMRSHSFVYFAEEGKKQSHTLQSKRMRLHTKEGSLDFQCFATCSQASLFATSSQRIPLSLFVLAILWAVIAPFSLRRRFELSGITLGSLHYDDTCHRFYNIKGEELHLTPLQATLLIMFLTADDHRLSKQHICDTLWPRKPDASDTLYTLIRRLKPLVEKEGGLRIVGERGQDYRLETT